MNRHNAIYFKFRSELSFKAIHCPAAAVNGPISAKALKEEIIYQHGFKAKDMATTDILLLNAQTEKQYEETDIIEKHASVIGMRVPKRKRQRSPSPVLSTRARQTAMRNALMYTPTQHQIPPHKKKRCSRPSGIPKSDLVPIHNYVPGAMLCDDGGWTIQKQHLAAYLEDRKISNRLPAVTKPEPTNPPVTEDPRPIPEEYKCPICSKAMQRPVIVSCCGNSACMSCMCDARSSLPACPLCNVTYGPGTILRDNINLIGLVDKWKQKQDWRDMVHQKHTDNDVQRV